MSTAFQVCCLRTALYVYTVQTQILAKKWTDIRLHSGIFQDPHTYIRRVARPSIHPSYPSSHIRPWIYFSWSENKVRQSSLFSRARFASENAIFNHSSNQCLLFFSVLEYCASRPSPLFLHSFPFFFLFQVRQMEPLSLLPRHLYAPLASAKGPFAPCYM